MPSRQHSPFRLTYPPSRSPSPPGQTVVSLTFDDGVSGAARAAEILNTVDMKGTFYMKSGLLDETGFMALRQAKGVAGPLIQRSPCFMSLSPGWQYGKPSVRLWSSQCRR
ncbi:polysaccharide deacetylase family protein [Arthrobacter sp. ZGTC212]|uniref:polysaccharide deacetylase family protein n=1 Tax=Arthrobacter sp. ZGTC212 TaxID=2058899 RepID=UPI0011B0478B